MLGTIPLCDYQKQIYSRTLGFKSLQNNIWNIIRIIFHNITRNRTKDLLPQLNLSRLPLIAHIEYAFKRSAKYLTTTMILN